MPATLPRRLPAPLTAAGLPPGVRSRAAAFGLVLLTVLAGHQALVARLAHWLQQPGPARRPPASAPPDAMTWRLVRTPAPSAESDPPQATPTADPHRAAALPPTAAARPVPAGLAPRARPGTQPPHPPPAEPDEPATASPSVTPAPSPAAGPEPEPQAEPPWNAPGALQAPPLYPTRLPPPATLRFTVHRGAQSGTGEWRWQPADGRFDTRLRAELAGQVWVDQHSQGQLDGAGLAPERLVERQRGRAARAVNFQRDKALVSFSGSTRSWPLWAGTQDRLSWLPQLLSVVAGRPRWQTGEVVTLATASPRGELALWQWRLADRHSPDGERETLHWVREPERPYDHRIDLWLEPQTPHWPLGWRWQVLPGGEPALWWREDAP